VINRNYTTVEAWNLLPNMLGRSGFLYKGLIHSLEQHAHMNSNTVKNCNKLMTPPSNRRYVGLVNISHKAPSVERSSKQHENKGPPLKLLGANVNLLKSSTHINKHR
jgi:hypothetical protein